MVHKGLQRHIISKDSLGVLRTHAAISSSSVGGRWVELRQEESGLRTSSITNNESRKWESVGDEILHSVN